MQVEVVSDLAYSALRVRRGALSDCGGLSEWISDEEHRWRVLPQPMSLVNEARLLRGRGLRNSPQIGHGSPPARKTEHYLYVGGVPVLDVMPMRKRRLVVEAPQLVGYLGYRSPYRPARRSVDYRARALQPVEVREELYPRRS